MKYLFVFLDSSVGQKAVAAATGLGLIAFVVIHMIGNLQVFLGPDAINSYAVKLKNLGPLLWVARGGLLLLFAMHIAMTVRLRFRNRAARNSRYALNRPQASTSSSRFMIVSGSIILLFVIFHLLHFTFGVIQPQSYSLVDAEGRHDIYSMVTRDFTNWAIAGFYLVAMLFLCSHLSHAMFSAWQSLGTNIGGGDTRVKTVARYLAVLTVFGFASIPIAALVGWFSGK